MPTKPLGDADGNGEVGFSDFLKLSGNFGKVDAVLADGDFNDDGNCAHFADFLLLAMNFGKSHFPDQIAADWF